MSPVDADVVLVGDYWDPKVDRLEASGISPLLHLALGVFDRPASIAVLLPDLGRPLFPPLWDLPYLIAAFSPSVLRLLGPGTTEH